MVFMWPGGQAQVGIKRGGLGRGEPVGVGRGRSIANYTFSWPFTKKQKKSIAEEGERAGSLLPWSGRHGREQRVAEVLCTGSS